jgi:putative ABC transport system permease protein
MKHSVLFNKKWFCAVGLNKPEDAIGKKIDFWGPAVYYYWCYENFHSSLYGKAFEPLIFRIDS